jgi:hypothetical protein
MAMSLRANYGSLFMRWLRLLQFRKRLRIALPFKVSR